MCRRPGRGVRGLCSTVTETLKRSRRCTRWVVCRGWEGCAGGQAGVEVIRGLNGRRFTAGAWPRGESDGCDAGGCCILQPSPPHHHQCRCLAPCAAPLAAAPFAAPRFTSHCLLPPALCRAQGTGWKSVFQCCDWVTRKENVVVLLVSKNC